MMYWSLVVRSRQNYFHCTQITFFQGCPEPSNIPCSNGSATCVSELRVCDGVVDCPEGSDEQNCGNGKQCLLLHASSIN